MSRSLCVARLMCLGLLMSNSAWAGESPAKALDARFLKAFNANDLDAIVACYADDAVIYPPGEFIARGRDAVRRSWQDFLSHNHLSNAKISDATYVDMGKTSVGWGIVEFTMTPAGGTPTPVRARFTSVSEARGGRWVFTSDHASVPMSEPGDSGPAGGR